MTEQQVREYIKMHDSCSYFINNYCHIYDVVVREWVLFKLWPFQENALRVILEEKEVDILKARQLGYTWLNLCVGLWEMIFRPIAQELLFSLREIDAKYLLSEERMRGIFNRLPDWLRDPLKSSDPKLDDSKLIWTLTNGSTARAFPVGRGDGYTATRAIIDEYDLLSNDQQIQMELTVRPTVKAGGKLVRLSKVDKKKPTSPFKKRFRKKWRNNERRAIFSAWSDHPGRDEEWYNEELEELSFDPDVGSPLDAMHENNPSTVEEALSPLQSDKRLQQQWLTKCYQERQPRELVEADGAPDIPGLRIYVRPRPGRVYVAGGDTAEDKETSDDCACSVVDEETKRQVAVFNGIFEPAIFAGHVANLCRYYNNASFLCERNNHGHAVILWLRDNEDVFMMRGYDRNPGWLTTSVTKMLMYSSFATLAMKGWMIIHDEETYMQLLSIQKSDLKAPNGMKDDVAVAHCIATLAALKQYNGSWSPYTKEIEEEEE